jgi:putative membrane protein
MAEVESPVSAATQNFITTVAMNTMFEIQSSQLIEPNADTDTKPFAQKMITDHTAASGQLKSLVQGGQVNARLPTELDADHQAKLDAMKKLSGEQLDRDYDQTQLQAHKDTVALFQQYAQNGDNPALKDWAAKTLPALQIHLTMAGALK